MAGDRQMFPVQTTSTRTLGSWQSLPVRRVAVTFVVVSVLLVLLGGVWLAVRGAAGVALMAALLVLAGAIAARAQERTREAAILKVLGASRLQVLSAYVIEYGLVGLISGAAGVALGYAAAWPVVVRVFEAQWSVDWGGVAALLGGASGLAALGGLMAAFQALSRRPAPALRSE